MKAHNTVSAGIKYRLYLIYFPVGLVYFSSIISYAPEGRVQAAPVHTLLVLLDKYAGYRKRKLLAKDLIEIRSPFAKTFTPLKV